MPDAVHCPNCDTVLRVPPEASGRRLKCPKCGTRFVPGGAIEPPSVSGRRDSGPRSGSAISAVPAQSSRDLPPVSPPQPKPRKAAPPRVNLGPDDYLPTVESDLRESFELPMLMDSDTESPASVPITAASTADVAGLFHHEPRKKVSIGDARMKARRCPTCGSVVPAGMSLCATCQTDLDTGVRVNLDDALADVAPGPPRPKGIPLGIAIIGGISALVSLLLAVVSIIQYRNGLDGAQFLAVVCCFGVYASVQFLRLKTIRLLMIAICLAMAVDVVGLIALPIVQANNEVQLELNMDAQNEDEEYRIASVTEKLDVNSIQWGIALLLGGAGFVIILYSPIVREHF